VGEVAKHFSGDGGGGLLDPDGSDCNKFEWERVDFADMGHSPLGTLLR
jgi:hypothetical protein